MMGHDQHKIAIVGMAGRFPGAPTIGDLWRNLCAGVESIRAFSPEELEAIGVPPEIAADPSYVPATGCLDEVETFDAHFFGFSPREAEILDPQDRLFLECAWEALEDSGYDPSRLRVPVGVYGGEFLDTYLYRNLYANDAYMARADPLLVRVLNDKDFLTTLVSYKLDLRGPSVAVQTACSTSLVAVHLAAEALLSHQCDLALAGGVTVSVPHRVGYRYREGSIFSPDGHCRPFSADARGTVAGNGAGVVVLKRLAEALEDGDRVYAVLCGSAINNDGSLKAGFTAPSLDGQAEVVAAAQSVAGIDPATVTYVEAHGTGTEVGDPIEVSALQQVFGAATDRRGFCGLGSIKSNLGHLEAAAGVTGLIKTSLALYHRRLPASLHCAEPHPDLRLDETAFYLVSETRSWETDSTPRRAGVSSFGVGGTNAHVVLEEAPSVTLAPDAAALHLLPLSAATPTALGRIAARLADVLEDPEAGSPSLADAAFTLQVGRKRLRHRRALVCADPGEAVTALRRLAGEVETGAVGVASGDGHRPVVFLFPGQGSQHPDMARELYDHEPVFRREMDRCAELLRPWLGLDPRRLAWPHGGDGEQAAVRLERTDLAQPVLFAVEWSLVALWASWGVRPAAMLGHSLGEYVAATAAGVLELEAALELVVERGRRMAAAPDGAMLTTHLPVEEALETARTAGVPELVVAAVNAPQLTVLSGPCEAVDRLGAHLAAERVQYRRLHTAKAFHSPAMEEVVEPLRRQLESVRWSPPEIPYLSNLTGDWIRPEEATDPEYWLRHLLSPVRFADALEILLADPGALLLEVGPGESLVRLARQQEGWRPGRPVASSLPHPQAARESLRHLLGAAGHLWEAGVEIDWDGLHRGRGERRRRVSLPTYPFERRRYWVDPPPTRSQPETVLIGEPAPAPERPPAGVATAAGRPDWLGPFVAPRDDVEATVARILSDVLGVPGVGVHDDFFELGGHSLLATQVTARLRDELGTCILLGQLHEAPTAAGLAEHVRRAGATAPEPSKDAPTLVPDPAAADEPFPLTDVQEAYWVGRSGAFELGEVATHWYLEVEEIALDPARFQTAWRRLIERHGALRTVILPDGRQRILRETPRWCLPVADLSALDPAAADRCAERLRRRMSHQVLDAGIWPLFDLRATIFGGGRARIHFGLDLLIADAWSFVVLTRELAALYENPDTELPPLDVTFRDYVVAERALRATAPYETALAYWRRRLADLPPAPELPLAARPEDLEQPRFERRMAMLEAPCWQRLKSRAAARGVTPSGLVLAVLAEVLGAWSKAPRFTLNLTLFNRLPMHSQVDYLVGDFTSLTLLAVDVSAGSFEERARRLQAQLWCDLDHRLVSGVRVMRELVRLSGGARRARMPVVFTSTLGMGGGDGGAVGLPGELVYSISQTPQVWLDVQVRERDGALRFNWDAVEELFPPGLLDDLFTAFRGLLERLGGDGEVGQAWCRPVFDLLPAVQAEEHAQANATASPAPRQRLHDAFLERASEAPSRLAVAASDGELTYGELETRSRRLAAALARRGARPEELVAVVLEKGWRQAVAVLGVGRAGAAYLPLDPALPAERLRRLLTRGEVRLAITSATGPIPAAEAWPAGVERLDLDRLNAAQDGKPESEAPPCPARPDHLAYVIFTSGSTGEPKGVMIEHAAAVNTLVDVNRRFAVSPADRVLALSSLSFDLSVYDIFGLLGAGGAVVMPAAGEQRDPARWLERMTAAGVTLWNSVPALLGMLVEHLEHSGGRLPSTLRRILLSGDWIPVDLPERARALSDAPHLRVISMGGATEASVWSVLHEIEATEAGWPSVPYGQPMANQRFHVLGTDGSPRPVWVPGQLYIGGAGVARGYWRDARRTATSFIGHPETGERLYATGDLGRWRPGGVLEFLGREDGQVKVSGYRIELAEVEAALLEHPHVEAAAVVATGEARGGRRLAGFVVGSEADPASVRSFLETRLPAYMVPTSLLRLDALLLSANGKVDRKALSERAAEPAGTARETDDGAAPTPPRGPLEETVAQVWAEVLEVGEVGVHDNFFELGGDSVLAIRVTGRVAARTGVEVPLQTLFTAPTVAGLAAALGGARPKPDVEPIPPRPQCHEAPLSFQQQRMWFLQQLDPESPIYHLPRALRLSGALQPVALAAALDLVEGRHEALRTRFAATADGRVVQRIDPPRRRRLETIDLTGLAGTDRAREGRRLVQQAIDSPFDLTAGPLLRRCLLRHAADDHVLVLNFHHLVSDGWSLGVLGRELEAGYPAAGAGRPLPLPPLPAQYGDFSHWQRQHLDDERLADELSFWRQHLEGAPQHLELPTDRPRPAVQTYTGSGIAFTLPPEVSAAVHRKARQHGATPFLLLGAVFGALVGYLSGQEDLLLGTPVANRPRPELEPLLGLFVNTVVLRTRLGGGSVDGYLNAFRDSSLEALSHQDLPFERLVDELAPDRDVRQAPLFQALFVYQNVIRELDELGDLVVTRVPFRTDTAMFDLSLTLAETAAGHAGWLEYNTDLFDRTTAQRWAWAFARSVAAAARDPAGRLRDLPWLSSGERQQILWEWSSTLPRPKVIPVHVAVRRQARMNSRALAVVAPDASLTYADLMHRVDALALNLRRQGVAPAERVGVALERGVEAVVALLAILTAGAAYVPLDPGDPPSRRAEVIRDGGLRRLVAAPDAVASASEVVVVPPMPARSGDEMSDGSPVEVDLDSPAYVIYTSGSTGRPKGVLVPHGALARHTASAVTEFGIGPGDRVLQFASLAFDTSAEEIYPTLTSGATLVLRGATPAGPPMELFAETAAAGVTVLDLPTSYWHLAALDEHPLDLPASLRLVIIGGEKALPEAAAAWDRKLRAVGRTDVRTVNTYGPTEATIVAVRGELPSQPPASQTASFGPDLGRPIAGVRAWVVDRVDQPVAPGVVGELLLGGGGVSCGYLNRPAETAERFSPDPWSQHLEGEAGARLYRTGDRVRWHPDGRLQYVGRLDHQVKVRGFRVEPEEIEARLRALPGVADAVVRLRDAGTGRESLVAYLQPADGFLSIPAVRQALATEVPSWMMPGAFLAVERFPRTAGGKVDVRALPSPTGRRQDQAVSYTPPVTATETAVATTWSRILGLDRIGVHDNFFDLGGNSILLIQVYDDLRRRFDHELRLVDLLQRPTVQALARHLAELESSVLPNLAEKEPALDQDPRQGRQRLMMRRRQQHGEGGAGR